MPNHFDNLLVIHCSVCKKIRCTDIALFSSLSHCNWPYVVLPSSCTYYVRYFREEGTPKCGIRPVVEEVASTSFTLGSHAERLTAAGSLFNVTWCGPCNNLK